MCPLMKIILKIVSILHVAYGVFFVINLGLEQTGFEVRFSPDLGLVSDHFLPNRFEVRVIWRGSKGLFEVLMGEPGFE